MTKNNSEQFNDLNVEFFEDAKRTLLDPFITQSIALERFTDVLPAEIGLGNRGGVTKTGSKIYSDTDSAGDKKTKRGNSSRERI